MSNKMSVIVMAIGMFIATTIEKQDSIAPQIVGIAIACIGAVFYKEEREIK